MLTIPQNEELLKNLFKLIEEQQEISDQQRASERLEMLLLSELFVFGRHTVIDGLFLENEIRIPYLVVYTRSINSEQSKLSENPLYREVIGWLQSIGIHNQYKNVLLTSSERHEQEEPLPAFPGIDLRQLESV